jgi:hypothetical protein
MIFAAFTSASLNRTHPALIGINGLQGNPSGVDAPVHPPVANAADSGLDRRPAEPVVERRFAAPGVILPPEVETAVLAAKGRRCAALRLAAG